MILEFAAMSDYQTLLAATMEHLRDLKARGIQHVALESDILNQLAAPLARPPLFKTGAGISVPPTVPASPPAVGPALTEKSAPEEQFTFLASPLAGEQREAAMADLRARALICIKCPHLASSRRNVVFGVGNVHTELMFVGEAPGADEDEQGEPFVGKAGQLLAKIIQTMGHSRQTVYIANILKCRPDTPGQLAGNRKPTPDEMKTCLPYLLAQIDIIRPKVIVALGATAVEGLFGKPMGIMKLRGNWQTFRDIPVMPTYHPAYLLRNQSMAEKRKVWEDMLQVLEKLGQPISEKQRGYFLKA